MQRLLVRLGRWSFRTTCYVVASVLWAASTSQAVPIDLTDATPSVTGATTLHIEGIATLGSSYWADFEWNEKINVFQVSAYGEEGGSEPPDGFVLVDPGTFMMGSPADELGRDSDETQHQVKLTQAFFFSEKEVTQAQWVEVVGSNPSYFPGCDECPVEQVSWYDAVEYCNALSALEDLDLAYEVNGTNVNWDESSNGYRLPTEAEWEYACRASTTTAFYSGGITETGCADPNLDEIGWYCGNASGATHEVGQKLSNAWGLYDMSGNAWEWCWDWYGEYSGDVTDPVGPDSGAWRVPRGGSWLISARYCRSADRSRGDPGSRNYTIGLRPARTRP